MMTTMKGVFVAGDVHRGVTFFVVDAINEGHRAARNIDCYLRNEEARHEPILPSVVKLSDDEIRARLQAEDISGSARVPISSIPLEERVHNFREVDLTLTEEEALAEADRCLRCAICSECLECQAICEREAIEHDMPEELFSVEVGTVIDAADPSSNPRFALPEGNGYYCVSPDNALMGSALAAKAMVEMVDDSCSMPVESNSFLDGGPARIGVFICQCGGEISRVINIESVVQIIYELPEVVHVQVLPYSCSPDVADTINTFIAGLNLNRLVMAACLCCPLAQVCYSCTYQRVRSKRALGLYSLIEDTSTKSPKVARKARLEFVNIREQCAYIHSNNPQAATEKAAALLMAAVSRIREAPIKLASARRIDKSVLILGRGKAAQYCWDNLNKQGVVVQHLQGEITEIGRAGGQYVVQHNEKAWQASALVLTPVNIKEKKRLLVEFGRERRRPIVHSIWGGLETHRPGVFLCSSGVDPEVVGNAAAARVMAWLYRTESRPPIAAMVDADRCRACKTCIETCEYGAPELIEESGLYHAWIDPAICTGCGTCAAHCPSGAITAGCSTDQQLQAMLGSFLSSTFQERTE
jgi:heterodisulfide reductase subunit A-like polyferredoxin